MVKSKSIQLISNFDAKRAIKILGLQNPTDNTSLILDISEEQENLLKQNKIDFIDINDPANYCF